MVILCSRDLEAMTTVDATLLAYGIDGIVWYPGEIEGVYELHVADAAHAEMATRALCGLWRDSTSPAAAAPDDRLPLWQQPAFAWGIGMASLLLAFYAVTGGSEPGGIWYRSGVFIHDPDVPFAPWRWVTAATLHAHMAHATGNAGMALMMFWAGAERLGNGVTSVAWLATAVAGFAASAVWGTSPAWVVGASGGLFGLLGAVGGHAWRYPDVVAYRPRMRTIGVVTMLLGMLAFSHDADVAAHLGGCAAGVLIGLACPRTPWRAAAQWSCVACVAAVVWLSWTVALRAAAHPH